MSTATPYVEHLQYECSNNHFAAARKPLTSCPVYPSGKPCNGTLHRIGAGSRKATT